MSPVVKSGPGKRNHSTHDAGCLKPDAQPVSLSPRRPRAAIVYTDRIVRKLIWLLLLAGLAAAGWFAWALLTPVEPAGQTIVMLRPGYSTRRIAAELQSAGVIRNRQAFLLWHYLHRGRSLKAGEYLFSKPATVIDVQNRMVRGDVYFHTLVVPEGFTIFDIAPNAPSLEGYLFPETYQFTRMMTMPEMAAAMVKQFRMQATQMNLIADVIGRPPDYISTIVIMASIVEKETAVPEERPVVAGVYYNRLAKHVALDADPSIIYAELLAGTYQGALHHQDMQFASAYNTYRNVGLPPGPIGNPGRTALEAAMHPAQTDYLYFVADAQGHHRFARTIEEHNKNVEAYRRAMRGH